MKVYDSKVHAEFKKCTFLSSRCYEGVPVLFLYNDIVRVHVHVRLCMCLHTRVCVLPPHQRQVNWLKWWRVDTEQQQPSLNYASVFVVVFCCCCWWWWFLFVVVVCLFVCLGFFCLFVCCFFPKSSSASMGTWFCTVLSNNDLLDLCLLIPSGTQGRNITPPANSILAGPL